MGEILISNHITPFSLGVSHVFQEFDDVFMDGVSPGLPPMRGRELQFDFIPATTSPIRDPYKTKR